MTGSGIHQRAALIGLWLLVALAGCNRFTRTKQCRALIAQVNPTLDDVASITGTGGAGTTSVGASAGGSSGIGGTSARRGPSGSAYLAAAARYERLAKQLGPMEFSTEEMARNVAEYASVLGAAAQALRVLAAAVDSDNHGEVERATRDLDRLSARERAALNRIDAWCQPGG